MQFCGQQMSTPSDMDRFRPIHQCARCTEDRAVSSCATVHKNNTAMMWHVMLLMLLFPNMYL